MKVCPQCRREYEDTRKVCAHDGTLLQPQPAAPKMQGLATFAQEVEQQRQEVQGRTFGIIVAVTLTLLLIVAGKSPWTSVSSPPAESQVETAAVVSAQPSSPVAPAAPAVQAESDAGEAESAQTAAAPADGDVAAEPSSAPPESGEEQVAHEQDAAPPEKAQEPETAAPEPAQKATTEEPGAAPEAEQQATAEEPGAAPEPEQQAVAEESVITPKPEQRAVAEESVIAPERGQSETAQKSVRSAGQRKEARRCARAEGRRQAQSVPADQRQAARGRAQREEPRAPMVWIYQTKTNTPLLSKAGASARVIRQLKPGEQLRVIGAVGDYFQVQPSEQGASAAYVRPQDMTLVRIE
ncbi:MAG: hypothetical protein ACREQ3_11040 [Candidatus Binatia bacterium]